MRLYGFRLNSCQSIFFGKPSLFSIASTIGVPLKIDVARAALSRPNVARVCIDLDISVALPDRIWIGVSRGGFWQRVVYENLPLYCSACSKQGHTHATCRRNCSREEDGQDTTQTQVYVPKAILRKPLAEPGAQDDFEDSTPEMHAGAAASDANEVGQIHALQQQKVVVLRQNPSGNAVEPTTVPQQQAVEVHQQASVQKLGRAVGPAITLQ